MVSIHEDVPGHAPLTILHVICASKHGAYELQMNFILKNERSGSRSTPTASPACQLGPKVTEDVSLRRADRRRPFARRHREDAPRTLLVLPRLAVERRPPMVIVRISTLAIAVLTHRRFSLVHDHT